MTDQPLSSASDFSINRLQSRQQGSVRGVAAGSRRNELYLKLLIVSLFLPEGLSAFIGDYRLSPARIVLIPLSLVAAVHMLRRLNTLSFVLVPSDIIALLAGIWMVLASVVASGFADGLKSGGALALEFTGAYYVFRSFLGPVDSSVRVVKVACKLMIVVVAVALLDPLTRQLFTYELVKAITGYTKEAYEFAKAASTDTIYRNGLVRAMGPFEHSILFGTACVWFGTLAIYVFSSTLFRWSSAVVAFVGVFFSQSQGSLLCFIMAFALMTFYLLTRQIAARWKVLGALVAFAILFICLFSANPLATLLRLGAIKEETGWYRQAIWEAGIPVVAQSPIFGIGLTTWDWQASNALAGDSVDAFWLAAAMMFGIPGSVLIFLTLASAFSLGAIDKSHYLSREEARLSVALGVVMVIAIFQGFTVHLWGACWILLGIFAGMRANLAEAAILRERAVRTRDQWALRGSRPVAIRGAFS